MRHCDSLQDSVTGIPWPLRSLTCFEICRDREGPDTAERLIRLKTAAQSIGKGLFKASTVCYEYRVRNIESGPVPDIQSHGCASFPRLAFAHKFLSEMHDVFRSSLLRRIAPVYATRQ